MGHEIGHVYHRHVAENYRRQRNTGIAQQLGVLAAGMLAGGAAAQAANLLTGVGAMAYLNTFSRDAEREADAFAVEVAARRRATTRTASPSFFATLIQQYGDGGASLPVEPPGHEGAHREHARP